MEQQQAMLQQVAALAQAATRAASAVRKHCQVKVRVGRLMVFKQQVVFLNPWTLIMELCHGFVAWDNGFFHGWVLETIGYLKGLQDLKLTSAPSTL